MAFRTVLLSTDGGVSMKLHRLLIVSACLTSQLALAADVQREDLLSTARELSSLDVLTSYLHSQTMLTYIELAQMGVNVQTPEGKLSKRKAKKISKEHQVNVEICEQVMQERGTKNLEGEYTFVISGDCEGAKAWWGYWGAQEGCGNPNVQQSGFDLTITYQCITEGRSVEIKNTGTTVDNAVIIVEELNSDYRYWGVITDGIMTFHIDAETVLASWPSFQKPLSREALESCEITMTPKNLQPTYSRE